MKIVNVCLAAVVCFFLQFSAVAGAAVEMVVGEYNRSTGTNWYFPGKKVTYKVSDSSVAEVLQGKDGQYRVHFIAPGEVYVYATFYSQGQPLEPELYLFHITGQAIDESATDWGTFALEILRRTNEERKKVGLEPLKAEFMLSDAAAIRAGEAAQVYSHTRPDGSPYHTALTGITYKQAGENLQAGAANPEEAMRACMNSPTHRENILYPDFNVLGVGYVYVPNSKYHHYWVQIFLQE